MSREDIRQHITDTVIAALESGGLKSWTRPWANLAGCKGGALPWNFATGHHYQGINTILLMMACMEHGFSSSGFVTFNQARQLGGNVRKGAKGFRVVMYRLKDVTVEGREGDEETRAVPFSRTFTVFNTDQCENLPGLEEVAPAPLLDDDGKLARVEAIRQRLCDDTGLSYARTGNRAMYMPMSDSLYMPAGEWNSTQDFCATLAHELVHSTGAKHRLNRAAIMAERLKGKTDRERYAFEELVAELGAAMLCAELGITGDLQHESYIASWLEALKNDKSYIFKAATMASQAHRYLMGEAVEDTAATEQSEAA